MTPNPANQPSHAPMFVESGPVHSIADLAQAVFCVCVDPYLTGDIPTDVRFYILVEELICPVCECETRVVPEHHLSTGNCISAMPVVLPVIESQADEESGLSAKTEGPRQKIESAIREWREEQRKAGRLMREEEASLYEMRKSHWRQVAKLQEKKRKERIQALKKSRKAEKRDISEAVMEK